MANTHLLKRILSKLFTHSKRRGLQDGHGEILSLIKSQKSSRGIVYLDVGSNGGVTGPMQWMIENAHASAIMIDMVEEWSKKDCSLAGNVRYVRAALGSDNTSSKAYLTKYPACSSCLPPNEELLSKYPVSEWFDVVEAVEIELQRFDSIAREHDLPQPDIIKIDTQGTESDVLLGMGEYLEKSICVEFECHMKQLYRGQKTFHHLYEYMTEQNFILRDMKPQGPFEGEAIEFNSYWSKRPNTDWEKYVVDIWITLNGIWPGLYFTARSDQRERMKMSFN